MSTPCKKSVTASLLIIALFLIAPFTGSAQKKYSKDEKAILDVIRLEEKVWSAGDIDAYVDVYAPLDSTRMILSKGAAYGKDSIKAFYKKYWPKEKMGKLVLDGEQLERLSKKFYYVTGYFHVTLPDGKTVHGRYSSLMIKIKGKWYLYTDHSS